MIVSLSLCLMGCVPANSDQIAPLPAATAIPKSPEAQKPLTKPQDAAELAQYLPITAIANIAGREIQLEVAATPSQQQQGLMFRPPLASDRGMLFPFQPARLVAFWMKNTPSPLDIIFLLDGEVKAIARDVSMCKTDPCPTYPSNGIVADNVIEVRAGLTTEIGLMEGDRLEIKFLPPKSQ
ncbi:MAG: hypothetical protein AUK48_04170 [Oscillatoriales cyanobacterium CG2_30_44_21]|nr:MAG: hypothetical protein AUK48_04170 [Oscillatoriales cyanobacterium CG2_30_44_21]